MVSYFSSPFGFIKQHISIGKKYKPETITIIVQKIKPYCSALQTFES